MKREYEKVCALCTHSVELFPSGELFCDLRGPVPEFGKCSKFYFDALKHKPSSAVLPSLEQYGE